MARLKTHGEEVNSVTVVKNNEEGSDVNKVRKEFSIRSNRWVLVKDTWYYAVAKYGKSYHSDGWKRYGRAKPNACLNEVTQLLLRTYTRAGWTHIGK